MHDWKHPNKLAQKIDAFEWDSHTHTLVRACTLSSCSCSRKARANICLQMHLLCPHWRFWAKWPRYYLHWETLESTVSLTQLKHLLLGKHAETWHARPRASEAQRGSWRVQEVAMLALSTLLLCPHPAAPPGAFRQPGSLTRDGLFLSILRRGYVYKVTFNVSTSLWGSSHT